MKKLDIVAVKWFDSIHKAGWLFDEDLSEFIKEGQPIFITIGILVHQSDEFLVVVQSVGNGQFDAAMKIPVKSIRSCIPIGDVTVDSDFDFKLADKGEEV